MFVIMLFNLAGYRLFFSYMENKAQLQLSQQLDKQQYDEAGLFEIKVPIHLPYLTDNKNFERCYGSVEINGEHYNYVKRKICNDTLIVLCISNQEQNRLSKAADEYSKLANEVPAGKTNTNTLLKSLVVEFDEQNLFYHFSIPSVDLKQNIIDSEKAAQSSFVTSPWQPPEIIA